MWNSKPSSSPSGTNAFSNPTVAGLATRRSPTNKPSASRPRSTAEAGFVRSQEDSELMSQITASTTVVHRRSKRDELPMTPTGEKVKEAMDAADSILTKAEAPINSRFDPMPTQGQGMEDKDYSSANAKSVEHVDKSTPASRRFEEMTRKGIEDYKAHSPRRLEANSANSSIDSSTITNSVGAGNVNKHVMESGASPLKSRFSTPPRSQNANIVGANPAYKRGTENGPSPLKSRHNTPPPRGNVVDTRGILSSAAGEQVHSSDRSVASNGSSRRSLDLIHNDNAFHVIASIVVERFQRHGSQGTYLDADDWKVLDASVPPAVRDSFVKAVRFRLKYNCPPNSEAHVHVLTRQCAEYNLAKEGDLNPLLREPSFSSSSTFEATVSSLYFNSCVRSCSPLSRVSLHSHFTTETNYRFNSNSRLHPSHGRVVQCPSCRIS